MKKFAKLFFVSFLMLSSVAAFAKPVARIDAEKQKDLSGNWNDKDIRQVCETLIDDCVESSIVKKFTKKYGRLPYVKLGPIMNLSDEFIDTTIIANKFRNAILNSGELKFVASDSEVEALRNEQLTQGDHVKMEEAAQMGNETGADFMLQGTVKTVIDQDKKTIQKTYYVDIELFGVESAEVVWTAENSDIVKVIDRKKVKL